MANSGVLHASGRIALPLIFIFLLASPLPAVGQNTGLVDGLLAPLLNPLVSTAAALAPITGAILGRISPFTALLNPVLQRAVVQNSVTQFTSDIVTQLTGILGVLINASLPIPGPIQPANEAPLFGFIGESYNVTTDDGYILGTFRIRSGECSSYRSVVVMPASILSDTASYMYILEDSLVYRLARRCFDVWLVSFRGMLFARAHITFSPNSQQFWDFNPYHYGAFDLPAQIEFIVQKTNSTRLRCMGLDQAGTAFFFMNHVHGQRYQRYFASCYFFAPIGLLGRLSSVTFDVLAIGRDVLTAAGALTLHGEFALQNPVIHSALYNLCGRISPLTCYYIFQLLAGNSTEINYPLFYYVFRNVLDGTGIQAFNWFLQQVGVIDRMTFFNFGATINIQRYGQATPPLVRLNDTTIPCAFYAMERSAVTVVEDVRQTWLRLNVSAQYIYEVILGYNAIGPLVPFNASGVYDRVVRQLEADLSILL